jgi:Zn-finger nucleic acid-binding protein
MQCPVDGEMLVMTERSGVEIDYCPKCRGVWLDRGELDKILERAAPPAPPVALAEPARPAAEARYLDERQRSDRRRDDDDDRRRYGDDDHYYRKKRRGGFLDDLFDF